MKHHVRPVGGLSGPEDVVRVDEGTRASGERSTTSGVPAAPWAPEDVVRVDEGTRASGG